MPKSFAQQIEDDENKIKRIREHQRMVRAKQAKQERNARTKRLVETGAIVEKAHGGAYDDEGRQTFSDGLNGIISVYDPSRGGNVDMRVIDVIDRRIPRLPRSETTTGTAAAASRTVQATAPQPAHAQPQSFTPNPPAHRTPDRSAAAGSVGLAGTAQPSLCWAEISDLVRNIFPTCRKYVVSSLL